MFSPHNTFSRATPPILIVRFYFKKVYFVFDVKNPSHKQLQAGKVSLVTLKAPRCSKTQPFFSLYSMQIIEHIIMLTQVQVRLTNY